MKSYILILVLLLNLPLFSQVGPTSNWYFGTNQAESVDANELMSIIDKKLGELNDDYAYARKYTLKKPIPVVIHANQFYAYLNSLGKAGSQTKFPRVMKKEQFESWKEFLQENS